MFFDRAQSKDLRFLFVALEGAEKCGFLRRKQPSAAEAEFITQQLSTA
jgi:hypothetical protein